MKVLPAFSKVAIVFVIAGVGILATVAAKLLIVSPPSPEIPHAEDLVTLDYQGDLNLTEASISGLQLESLTSDQPPLIVLSDLLVENLNVEFLGGYAASDFLLAEGTAADSSKLAGLGYTYYLNASNLYYGTVPLVRLPDLSSLYLSSLGGTLAGDLSLNGHKLSGLQLVIFSDGTIQTTAQATTATLVVCASNSRNTGRCDYQADGTDDQVQIQAAIDALPSGGGTVVLGEGTFHCGGAVTLKEYTSLTGQGIDRTNLSIETEISSFIITNPPVGTYYSGVGLYDMTIKATQRTTSHLVNLIRIQNTYISNIYIDGGGKSDASLGSALYIAGGRWLNLNNIWASNFYDDGIAISNSWYINLNNVFVRNSAGTYSGSSGIEIDDGAKEINVNNVYGEGTNNAVVTLHAHSGKSGPQKITASNLFGKDSWAVVSVSGPDSTNKTKAIEITNFTGDNSMGFHVGANVEGITTRGGKVVNTGSNYGGWITATESVNVLIEDFSAIDGSTYGIRIDGSGANSKNIKLKDIFLERTSSGYNGGIYATAPTTISIIDSEVYGNWQSGIRADGTTLRVYGFITDVTIGISAATGTPAGIFKDCKIDSTYALLLYDSGNRISGCDFSGSTNVFHASSDQDQIFFRNVGYVTENSGTATVVSGQTTIDVTHGLAITPSINDINVVPTNNLGSATKYWISDVGASTFRINVDVDPGATTATFSWQIGSY